MRTFSNIEGKKPVKMNESTAPPFRMGVNRALEANPEDAHDTLEQSVPQEGPAIFISKLFESKEVAHIFHIQVNGSEGTFASHTALQTYYEEVLSLIDDLVEVYQAQNDVIEGYEIIDTTVTRSSDPISYFIELGEFIKQTRFSAIDEADQASHAIVDEILILLYKTLYKLRFNK